MALTFEPGTDGEGEQFIDLGGASWWKNAVDEAGPCAHCGVEISVGSEELQSWDRGEVMHLACLEAFEAKLRAERRAYFERAKADMGADFYDVFGDVED